MAETAHQDVAVPSVPKTEFVDWLRALAAKGGKGVVNNIDARSLGSIADRLESLSKALSEAEAERDRIKIRAACLADQYGKRKLAEAIRNLDNGASDAS